MPRPTRSIVLLAALAAAAAAPAQTLEAKLTAGDGGGGDVFGESVAVSEGTVVVGASGWVSSVANAGAVYVFRRTGDGAFEEVQRLTSSPNNNDRFGTSVAIDGGTLVAGSPFDFFDGDRRGSAFVWERQGDNTWLETQRLFADDSGADDAFGQSVSISGDFALVGAPANNDNGPDSGSAYVFRREPGGSWVQEAKLLPSDGAANDFFGFSVALDGDVAVVGAGSNDDNGTDSGSAYVFRRNVDMTWTEEQKLLPSDGAGGDFFGESLDIDGELILVGSLLDSDDDVQTGSAYVFRTDGAGGWDEVAKLLPSNGVDQDRFGFSVAIDDRFIVVSARLDAAGAPGAAYIFVQASDGSDDWTEASILAPTELEATDQFGFSVAVDGFDAVSGALRDDDEGSDAGAAYVFDLTPALLEDLNGDCNENGINDLVDLFVNETSADCNDNGIPDECDIASGTSLDANGDGIPDECGLPGSNCPGDVDGDDVVTINDLNIVLFNWENVCEP